MVQDEEIGRILLYAYDYEAGESFDVVSQLETSTTVRMLLTAEGETVPEISQPDEYTGHVIRYQVDDGPQGPTTFLFVREGRISAGESASLSEDATMFSSRLNLLATSVE